jgi:hypothetical protein
VLQVWIDDSGRGQDPVFVLAGYVGRVRNWIGFAHKWTELLGKHGLKYLKGNELWKVSDETVLQFVSIINQYALSGVRIVIPHKDFHDSLKKDRIAKEARWYFNQPYHVAFDCLFASVLGYVRKRPNFEKVEFVFDRDVIAPRNVNLAYSQLIKNLGPDASYIAGEPTFRDDKCFAPLQAADLLAWHVRRDYYERAEGRKLQSPVWAALCQMREIQVELDRKDLFDLRTNAIERIKGLPW